MAALHRRYGFVYFLGNDSMPGLIKIGYTERSPHLRALELSKATGVPSEFYVLGYVETDDPKSLEACLHAHFHEFRTAGKEFFRMDFEHAWSALREEFDVIARTLCCDGEIAIHRIPR